MFVTHVESTHHLENWNFDWEVNRRNNTNCAVRKPVRSVVLTSMISGILLTLSQKSDTVTTKVFEEVNSDVQFSIGLRLTFG